MPGIGELILSFISDGCSGLKQVVNVAFILEIETRTLLRMLWAFGSAMLMVVVFCGGFGVGFACFQGWEWLHIQEWHGVKQIHFVTCKQAVMLA